ncbi:hypothetical protein J2X77_002126 [Sphingobacterium sp. 2149]|nr:hypothetical protein [Sphingobacterium sp. 2149]
MFIVYRGTSILMAPFLFISAILRSAKYHSRNNGVLRFNLMILLLKLGL